MTRAPVLSTIICTRNRAGSLARALASIDRDPSAVARELVLVDNGSTDDTTSVFDQFRSTYRWPALRVPEPTPGLSRARNAGVRAASGEIVAFLDDDVIVAPGWADEIVQPFSDARVQGVGGSVEPAWATGRPSWFHDEFLPAVGAAGLGDQPGVLDGKLYPIGANMAFRRSLFGEIAGFDERLGRVDRNLVSAEEVEFAERVRRLRGVLWFAPGARVVHHVPAERSTKSYVLARRRADGLSIAAWDRLRSGPSAVLVGLAARLLVGVPRDALSWLVVRAGSGADRAFRFRCRLVKHLGYVTRSLQLRARDGDIAVPSPAQPKG